MFDLARSVWAQITARVDNRVGGDDSFFSAASDMVELCPSEVINGRPVKFLPDQIERVTASPFGASPQGEVSVAHGGPRQVNPTRSYVFKDVTVAKRWVISGRKHEEFRWPRSEWAFSKPERIAKAAFADSIHGSRFFGHWLRDDCATNLILPADVPLVRPQRDKWADEHLYSELLGLRQARSIKHARIDELIYIDDLSNNSHKLVRLKKNRSSIRRRIKSIIPKDIVYISRGPSARGRNIDNEMDLINALQSYGVKTVVAEELEPSIFLQEILDANLIISAEGSQCAHAIFALRDRAAGLITLQPHDRFYLPHLEWVRLLGFDFGVVVSNPDRGDFWIDPSEVIRTIDLFGS